MDFILFAFFFVALFFLGVPGFYFLYMKKRSAAIWNLDKKADYFPTTAIFVPVYNEEKTIRLKLENLAKVSYSSDKMEIIIVNDSSKDNTLKEVNEYIKNNPSQKISIFDSKEHLGKTGCLNCALRNVSADVVIISDADCFWPHDILQKALVYLSDPDVGAITARELLLNPKDTWVTVGEQFYNDTVQTMRVGESKLHSTLFFQGGFAAFKRSMLEGFNNSTDDSGTALDVIQKRKRAILIPEIGFYTTSPTIWRNKIAVKIRRASQLQQLWGRCLNLLVHGKLAIPKRIAIPEILLHIFNPMLLVSLVVLSGFAVFLYPLPMLMFALIIVAALLFRRVRTTFLEVFQSNLILLAALISHLTNRKFKLWKPIQESRFVLSESILKEKKLI
jgi:poly-beta-1,6-N-acetyl-D-glucosamine synthase